MEELSEMKTKLQKETLLRKAAEEEVNKFKSQLAELKKSEVCLADSTSHYFLLFCYLYLLLRLGSHITIPLMFKASAKSDISKLQKKLEDEACQKEKLEGEIAILQSQLLQISFEADEVFSLGIYNYSLVKPT